MVKLCATNAYTIHSALRFLMLRPLGGLASLLRLMNEWNIYQAINRISLTKEALTQ